MKLRWTPRERCTPEQSMHRKTPYVMLAQLGFLAPQSKQAWMEEATSEGSGTPGGGRARTPRRAAHARPLACPRAPAGPGELLSAGARPRAPPAQAPCWSELREAS